MDCSKDIHYDPFSSSFSSLGICIIFCAQHNVCDIICFALQCGKVCHLLFQFLLNGGIRKDAVFVCGSYGFTFYVMLRLTIARIVTSLSCPYCILGLPG